MEDFNKLRDKITSYHSPFSLDEEWNNLLVKKENIALKQKVRRRNIIITVVSLLVLLLLGTCSYKKYAEQKNNILTTLQKEETTLKNEQKTIENNHQTKTVEVEKKNNAKIEETVNNRTPNSAVESSSLKEQPKNEIHISNTKNKNTGFPANTNTDFVQQNENKFAAEFENELNQNNSNYNLDTISKLLENNVVNTKADPTKNIKQENTLQLPVLQIELIQNDSLEALSLPNIDSLKKQPPIADRKNYLFLEAFGQGAHYSLNYGRTISRQSFGMTDLQVGISYTSLKYYFRIESEEIPGRRINTLLVPMSINQSIRLKGNHHLTFGLGATLLFNRQIENESNFSFLGIYKLGYLYQPKHKRLFYKVEVLSPFYSNRPAEEGFFPCLGCTSIEDGDFDIPKFTKPQIWGGVGIGWRF